MIDEMQDELDTAHTELNEMIIRYEQSVKNTVTVLRDTGLSEQEIVDKIRALYHFDEKQARKYL